MHELLIKTYIKKELNCLNTFVFLNQNISELIIKFVLVLESQR